MTWAVIVLLAAGAYAFKAAGLIGGARLDRHGPAARLISMLPPALLTALVLTSAFSAGDATEVGTRLAGVVAGGLAAWRRAPVPVVLAVAAAVTAALRALLG